MCFACHGVDTLGSSIDVQSAVEATSAHSLEPSPSAFGPSPKRCSSCHDTHGSARIATGVPYPGLLRAKTSTNAEINRGDEFCGACHAVRAGSLFPGVTIWKTTAHARRLTAPSATGIVCATCHDAHGSAVAPMLVSKLSTPNAPSETTVTANNRTFCVVCHSAAYGTWDATPYAGSVHGSSAATVAVSAEYASAEASRAAGECQACHVAMGAPRQSGSDSVPKLVNAEGRLSCYRCHGVGSKVATDIASIDHTPTVGEPDLVLSFGATTGTRSWSRVTLVSRVSTAVVGLGQSRDSLVGTVGPVAAGDFDADGIVELATARSGLPSVTVQERDPLGGMRLAPGTVGLLANADFLVAADVLPGATDVPELVTASGSTLRVYRWSAGAFVPLETTTTAGVISGLAAGPVLTSTADELVVTTTGPDRVIVYTGGGGVLELDGNYASAKIGPRGPSVGDLTGDGLGEIAVANGGEASDIATVYDSNGVALASAVETDFPTQAAVSTVIADVFTATADAELVVVRDRAGTAFAASRIEVFPQLAGPGVAFDVSQASPVDGHANPTQAAVADVDGNGRPEVVAALAGQRPSSTVATAAPGVFVLGVQPDNLTLGSGTRVALGGVEWGGPGTGADGAWVTITDLGDPVPSRHAFSRAPGVHNSTETVGFARHVECTDCHDVHESTSALASAPAVYGQLVGAWGVSILNAPIGSITYTERRGVRYEYEVCLKCHGLWSASGRTRDIASEFDTRLASFHAVEGTSTVSEATAGSFVATSVPWSNTSRLYCGSCHGTSDGSQAAGPHYSPSAPLLRGPVSGTGTGDPSRLCFDCHRYDVYYTGAADGIPASTSNFYDQNIAANPGLHSYHVGKMGVSCVGCHRAHGSSEEHMIRTDVDFTHTVNGGSCRQGCHAGGASRQYVRP